MSFKTYISNILERGPSPLSIPGISALIAEFMVDDNINAIDIRDAVAQFHTDPALYPLLFHNYNMYHLIYVASRHGYIELVKYTIRAYFELCGCPLVVEIFNKQQQIAMSNCCIAGILKPTLNRFWEPGLLGAVEGGYLDIADYIFNAYKSISNMTRSGLDTYFIKTLLETAVLTGRMDIVEYVFNVFIPKDDSFEHEDYDSFEHEDYDSFGHGGYDPAFDAALRTRHDQIAWFIFNQDMYPFKYSVHIAALYGRLDMIRYKYTFASLNVGPYSDFWRELLHHALRSGHVKTVREVLDIISEHEYSLCNWPPMFESAGESGNVELV